MAAWLVSSMFISDLPDGREVLSSVPRLRSGPDAHHHRSVAQLEPDDLILLWDLDADALTRTLLVVDDFSAARDGPDRYGAWSYRKIVSPQATLPVGLDKAWLKELYNRDPRAFGSFKLFRESARGIQFHRKDFCKLVQPAFLAELGLDGEGGGPAAGDPHATPVPVRIRTRPSRGPAPTEGVWSVEREASGPGTCYLLRFEGSDTWKVGFSGDVERRLAEINRHVPRLRDAPCRLWRRVDGRGWPSLAEAFADEQATMGRLAALSVGGEQFQGTEGEILALWSRGAPGGRREGAPDTVMA